MSSKPEPARINFAASAKKTRALGPGLRSVLWVRGCNRRCQGCISPEWWSHQPEQWVSVEVLARRLLIENPAVRGITISGGEAFLQAEALAELLRFARNHRPLDTILYSGYTLAELRQSDLPGADALLSETDVLIDGEFLIEQLANDGIRGSTNQEIHFFSNRIMPAEFFLQRNPTEVHTANGYAFMIGVPTEGQLSSFHSVVDTMLAGLQTNSSEMFQG